MKTKKRTTERLSFVFSLLLGTLLLAGCARLNYLDRAQEAFSQGAEIENRQLFAGADIADIEGSDISRAIQQEMTNLSPAFFYTQAYADIKKALEKETALASDGLLGNALALKALCEWKLKRYGEARLTAEAARTAFANQPTPSPRDEAVMGALEGFIENDMAFSALGLLEQETLPKINTGSLSATQARVILQQIQDRYQENFNAPSGDSHIEKALRIIGTERERVTPNHPVQAYLVMSQLVCVKNWSDAISLIDRFLKMPGLSAVASEARPWWREEADRYIREKDKYLEELAGRLPGGEQNQVYLEWKQLLF